MGAAIASMSIAIVPLFLVEVTLPAPAQGSGNGFSALSANWDAFCQYHFAPLLESVVDGNFAPFDSDAAVAVCRQSCVGGLLAVRRLHHRGACLVGAFLSISILRFVIALFEAV